MKSDSPFELPLKPGHTTTEFWLVILTGLISTALAAISLLDVGWAVGAITVLTLAYTGTRSRLKQIQANAEAELVKSEIRIAEAEAMHDITQLDGLKDLPKAD